MSKKKVKMCQWIDRCWYHHNRKELIDRSVCPKGVNDKCELVPAKPKVVKIKAWVDEYSYNYWKRDNSSVCYLYHEKVDGIPCFPVTITIAKKHLKGEGK